MKRIRATTNQCHNSHDPADGEMGAKDGDEYLHGCRATFARRSSKDAILVILTQQSGPAVLLIAADHLEPLAA